MTCLLLAVSGCGEPTIDDRYAGKPLLQASGNVVGLTEAQSAYPLRASLFWSRDGKFDITRIAAMQEDNSVKIQMEFPSTLRLSVFKPPKPQWMVPDAGYAVGAIVLYEDRVGKGRYIPGRTPIRGGAPETAVFYSPNEIPASGSPFRTPIGPGMMHLELPLPCGFISFPDDAQEPSETCNAGNIGAACTQDSHCRGNNRCLKTLDEFAFPQGYCSRKATDACHPRGTVRIETHDTVNGKKAGSSPYLLKACDRDSDCRRKEGYACDPFIRACLPARPILLEVNDDFNFRKFCIELPEGDPTPDSSGTDSTNDIQEP